MRTTKRGVNYQMRCLARETGLRLELEQSIYGKKSFFTLYQIDENGKMIRWLIEENYTTKEMYLALRAAREIFKATTIKLQSSTSENIICNICGRKSVECVCVELSQSSASSRQGE